MVTKTIELQTTQTTLDDLLALVREGTEVVLMEGKKPLARLMPAKAPRILGLHAHLGPAWMSEDFDEPLPDEFWLGDV